MGAQIDQEFTRDLHRALAPIGRHDAAGYITQQLSIAQIKGQIDDTQNNTKDKMYDTNEIFWQDVISERLKANTIVQMNEFILTEWIP